MDEQDDEHYTSGEGAPASHPEAGPVRRATACGMVVFVLVIACCLARRSAPGTSRSCGSRSKSRAPKGGENEEPERQRRRALARPGLPLQRGAFATITARLPSLDSVLGRQTYLQVWKGLKTRAQQNDATYFGYPTVVWFFMWLLYATFNGRKSTGDIEQRLARLSFVFVLQSTASTLCAEKAAKLRESLRAMGLRELAYWAGPLIVDGLLYATALGFILACVVRPAAYCTTPGAGTTFPRLCSSGRFLGCFRPRRRRSQASPVVFRRSAARRPRRASPFALTDRVRRVVHRPQGHGSRPPSGTTTLSYGSRGRRPLYKPRHWELPHSPAAFRRGASRSTCRA